MLRTMRPRDALALALLLTACGCAPATPVASPQPVAPATPVPPAPPGDPVRTDGPPAARVVDVVEDIAGAKVRDPYRWMEGTPNPELDTWLGAQGAYAAKQLAGRPGHDALLERIREVGLGTSGFGGFQRAGDRLFYFATPPDAQLARVEWIDLRKPGSEAHVLLDPARLNAGGAHFAIDSFAPSADGKLVAYNLSQGGAELTSIHVLDVARGKDLPDVIEHVWGEFAATWLPDGSGFFYTRMADAAPGVDPLLGMHAKLHRLGQPVAEDPLVLGPGTSASFPIEPQEFPVLSLSPGSRWVLAYGSGARSTSRLAIAPLASIDRSGAGKTPWVTIAGYDDGVEGADLHGDRLYLISHKDAPNRRVLSLPAGKPVLAGATVVVPEDKDAALVTFAVARDALYLSDLVAGHGRLRRLPWKARAATTVPLPYEGSIGALVALPGKDGVRVTLSGWTQPEALYAWKRGALTPTGLAQTTPVDTKDLVAEEVEVPSADGTRVPLSILHRKDTALDGSHLTIVTGYGGYATSLQPAFSAVTTVWLERGGVHAVCHVRGGGEKGAGWHEAGRGPNKLNGVRDLIACGEYLVAKGYTTSRRLAATGRSMGGVLVGRAITLRPELFGAALIGVGVVNPLRILQAENGANQVGELGSPATPEGAQQLLAMDPYQHVEAGVAYPAVLFTVGLNDRRVAPWMTGKMAARLQASSTSGRPVLVRIDADAGHGVGSTRDQAYAQRADEWTFLLAAAGDPAFVTP